MTDAAEQHELGAASPFSSYSDADESRMGGVEVESALSDPTGIDPGSYPALADAILTDLSSFVFRDVFPTLSDDMSLSVLRLPIRAQTVLGREGLAEWRDLADLRVSELMVMRGMGARTITDILVHVIRLSVEAYETLAVHGAGSVPAVALRRRRGAHAPLSPTSQMLEAIEILTAWSDATGDQDAPLLSTSGRQERAGVPQAVIEARVWLRKLTATEWGAGREDASISDRVHFHLDALDDRERSILLARVESPSRKTLEVLGLEHGVTRERIRQIEARVKRAMRSWLHDDPDLAFAAAGVRHRMGPLAHRESLNAINGLSDFVDGTEVTVLEFLDAMDDGFSGGGGWYGAPSIDSARTATALLFSDLADAHGGAWHEDVETAVKAWAHLSDDDLSAWLEHLGYQRIAGVWVAPDRRSIPDRVAAVLSDAAETSSLDDLHATFGGGRSIASVRNALAADDRFQRVGRDRWGLAEWGGEAYMGIKAAISASVLASSGSVLLDDLIRDLPDRLRVSANSVRTYAAGWPFELRGGAVSFAAKRPTPRKNPYLTRRLYMLDEAVALRLTVTNEHLRGSGLPASTGVALALGMAPGAVRTWVGDRWDTTLSWSNAQPQLSSIRLALVDIDAAHGDEVMITWRDEAVSIRSVVLDGTAAALLGDPTLQLAQIAEAIGLAPTASWHDVGMRAEARGEDDLAEACHRETAGA
jgi:hypothetical protein